MKVNKYRPVAFIYFFVNAIGLPLGILYTTVLTPLFYFWLLTKGKTWIILKFILLLLPFLFNHIFNGVDLYHYLRSTILLFTVYIFCYAFYTMVKEEDNLSTLFYKLSKTNFTLTIVAILFLVTPWRYLFWGDWNFSTAGIDINMPRLRMFTYEPSYYATLLVPLFVFYFATIVLGNDKRKAFPNFLLITIPLILSWSMGVISGICIAIAISIIFNFHRFLSSKKLLLSLFILSITIFLVVILLFIFYRDNPIFVRMTAFLSGDDQSGRGRTNEAFELAYLIAEEKSIWWGVGQGQLKIIGDPIIREFYSYQSDYGQVSIPNAFAETIALFGIVGASVRFLIQIYLFFRTRVLNNYFRTTLFFYIFIYQFTGSFTTNVAEYVIWILAFTNVFPQFDKHANKLQSA